MKITATIVLNIFFLNTLFAQFSPEQVISRSIGNVRHVETADMNGDGQLDIIAAGNGGVVWYENNASSFSKEHVVYFTKGYSISIDVADIDTDGDTDVLVLDTGTDRLEWYLNDGNGVFLETILVSTAFDLALEVHTSDLDGDGDLDVAMSNSGEDATYLFFNDGSTNFSEPTVLSNPDNSMFYFTLSDLDNDGDQDIIGAGSAQLGWYENDGTENFNYQSIFSGSSAFRALIVADYNTDEQQDIIVTTSNRIWVFENDGAQNFTGVEHGEGITGLSSLFSVGAEDMNDDGYLDLFYTSYYQDNVGWFQSDGEGSYPSRIYVDSDIAEAADLVLDDFNNDGIKDIVFVGYQEIVVGIGTENQNFMNQTNVLISEPKYASGVGIMDVDNDGDMDVIASYRDNTGLMEKELVWHENVANKFPQQHSISTDSEGVDHLELADINHDGWVDILVAKENTLQVYPHNGNDGFDAPSTLVTNVYNNHRVADMDGDGDLDLIYNRNVGTSLYWIANDGSGNFDNETYIAGNNLIISFNLADIDGDNDLDIIYVDYTSDYARWRANDGNGNFSTPATPTIGTGLNGAHSIEAGDLDGDNDLDVVVTASIDDYIQWFENDGSGSFTEQSIISTREFPRETPLGDIDNDGDLDVLGVFYSDYMTWYSNDGNGNFQEEMLISAEDGLIETAILADVNANNGLDVLAGFNFFEDQKVVWYESSFFEGSINASITNVNCFDNDTPFDITDDIIEFSIIVNQTELGNDFMIGGAAFSNTGIYGEEQTYALAVGSAGNGDVSLTITDSEDPNYSINVSINDPGICSSPPSITAELNEIGCNDNSTPTDMTDDIIEFSLLVNEMGLEGPFQITSDAGVVNPNTGNYGELINYSLEMGSAGNGNVVLTINDIENPIAFTNMVLSDPGSCSLDTPVEEQVHTNIYLYPNPSKHYFYVIMTNDVEDCQLRLYNNFEQSVHVQKCSTNRTTINTSNLANGTYYYQLLDTDNVLLARGKLIKVN